MDICIRSEPKDVRFREGGNHIHSRIRSSGDFDRGGALVAAK